MSEVHFSEYWRQMKRKHRFKACLHPNTKACSGPIIDAHSIQRNRHLRNIADNGMVMMFRPEMDDPPRLIKVGLKKATVFSGFCKHHDQHTFASIESADLDEFTERQCFLFAYRAFAREFCAKAFYFGAVEETIYRVGMDPRMAHLNASGKRDLCFYKRVFDEALLSGDLGRFVSRQRVLKGEYPLAASALASIDRKLDGNLLYDTYTMREQRVPLVSFTILPKPASITVVTTHLVTDDGTYSSLLDEVFAMSDARFMTVLSYLALTFAENWAIGPALFRTWSESKQKKLGEYFGGTVSSSMSYLDFVAKVGSLFEPC